MFLWKTDEQKMLCAEKIVEVIADTLGCKTSSVSVAIKDVPVDQWKEKVWDAHIIPDEPYLYKKMAIHVNKFKVTEFYK